MKKLFALLLALAMVFSLAACAGGETKPAGDDTKAPTETGGEEAKGSVYYLNFKPEFDTALQQLAKDYTTATGVEVKVVTAASGTYSDTLTAEMGKENPPTIFNIGNLAGLADWDEYALDLTDSAIAKELATNDFNLYNEDGALKAIGNCYESFGIIVNVKLLKDAGYELSAIKNFASLKAAVEDIHARAAELGFDAFTSAGLAPSSSWRFSGHLATIPLHYEGITGQVATIKGDKLGLFKNVWDLYINNSATAPADLTSATGDQALEEFGKGKAVFYQNGSWEFANLCTDETKGYMLKAEDLTMIPIYCGVEGEEEAGLCSGTENCWAVNSKASKEDIQATLDFMYWVVTSDEGTQMMADNLGPIPFKSAKTPENSFFAAANEYTTAGNYVVTWAFNWTPNVDDWRAGVVSALAAYSAGTGEWTAVEEAFVNGWAYQYANQG